MKVLLTGLPCESAGCASILSGLLRCRPPMGTWGDARAMPFAEFKADSTRIKFHEIDFAYLLQPAPVLASPLKTGEYATSPNSALSTPFFWAPFRNCENFCL